MRAVLVLAVLVVAGCATKSSGEDFEDDVAGGSAADDPGVLDADERNASAPGAPPLLPLLDNLTRGDLVNRVVSLHVEAGTWALARITLTPEMWGEDLPWDGDAEVTVGYTIQGAEGGYQLLAVLHKSPFDDTSRQTHAWRPIQGENVGWFNVKARAATDEQEMPPPPTNEIVVLVGDPAHAVSLRMGLLNTVEGRQQVESEIRGREATSIRPDLTGTRGFGGGAYYTWTGSEWETWSIGPVEIEAESGIGPIAAATAARIAGNASVQVAGTIGISAAVWEQAGMDQWNYTLDFPTDHRDGTGLWVFPPPPSVNALHSTGGVLQEPVVSYKGPIQPGQFAFDVQHRFTGLRSEPIVGVPQLSVTVGYANLDLTEAFGWPEPDGAQSGDGMFHCTWMRVHHTCQRL